MMTQEIQPGEFAVRDATMAESRGVRQAYVTAFSGRRDGYQVPLSLHENGRLESFITDAYDAGPVARLLRAGGMRGLAKRRCPELPEKFIEPRFRYELGGRLLQRLMPPSRGAVIADDWLARAAAFAANRRRASVLLYEFQAELGFRLLASPRQRKILFHFHPHPDWEHPLLRADVREFPEFQAQLASSTRANLPARFANHTKQAWRQADHVIVASSCTRDSLLAVGCPPERLSVVPYGRENVEVAAPLAREPAEGLPFLLWVGTGAVRKGLHHLCRAWKISGAARAARLIVVARTLEAGMEKHLAVEGVRWVPGLPRAELNWYFRHARAFVMPSLAEGFGHVYLEALAHGCPVIGTRRSVLPDLAAAQPWIRYVAPGDSTELAHAINASVADGRAGDAAGRARIAESVGEFTWERFRHGLEAVLRRFD